MDLGTSAYYHKHLEGAWTWRRGPQEVQSPYPGLFSPGGAIPIPWPPAGCKCPEGQLSIIHLCVSPAPGRSSAQVRCSINVHFSSFLLHKQWINLK